MTEIISDTERATKEGGMLVEALLQEVDGLLEDQIKSWNHMKSLTTDDEKLKPIFKREHEIKKLISYRRSMGLVFVKTFNSSESTKIAVKEEYHGRVEDDRVRLEKMKVPTFGGHLQDSKLTLRQ